MVSSKKGPSSGSGLSKRASVWSPPAVSRPSSATSRPGMNSSTSSASASSPLGPTSSRARIAAIGRNGGTKPWGPWARTTPRPAEGARAFSTHGYPASRATRAGSAESGTRRNRGAGTPAAPSRRRISCLLRAAVAAATGLDRRPRRAATAAATTVVRSSTATTASIGRRRAKRARVSAAPSGSAKSTVIRWSGARSSRVLGRSEAQTRSTPSLVAASTKACVRYVVVGRSNRSRAMEFGMASPADGRARGLGFARRVVGIGAGGVVGRVQDLDDLGELILDEPLDARLQSDVGGAAPLTAAAHLEVDPVFLHVDQLDVAAVAGDRRVDHGVDQLLDFGLQLVAHGCTSQTATVPEIPLRANWPSVGSAQQNHGSVRRGWRGRSGGCAPSGRGGAPAVSSARRGIRLDVAGTPPRAAAAPAAHARTPRGRPPP